MAKPTKPVPLPVPAPAPAPLPLPETPVVTKTAGSAVRLKLPGSYGQASLEVKQVSRNNVYEPLLQAFGGSHTDPDGSVVVPGVGTDYPGEFRLRIAASATNQAGQELVLVNPTRAWAPAQAPAPTPGVLPIPAAPTLVAVQNLAVRIQLPMGFRDLSLIELELL